MPFLKDLRVNAGKITLTGPVTLNHSGAVDNSVGTINNKSLFVTNSGNINNGDKGELQGSIEGDYSGGCDCQGVGYVTPVLTNEGQVTPGGPDAADGLCLTGDYDQKETGVLNIELGGPTPVVEYDQLIVNGDVTLSGSIRLVVLGAFQPKTGDEFEVMSVCNGTVTGTFDNVVSPMGIDLVYTDESVKAVITRIAGDADNDGDVDLDDYAGLFECLKGPDKKVGRKCEPFDFDADNDVDMDDVHAFQIRFTGSGG